MFCTHFSKLFVTALVLLLYLSPTRADENEIIVVSPHWDGIKEETSRAFSTWHEKKYGQRATIRWRETGGGSSQIIRFLRAEYKSHSSAGIDVLYGGGVDPYHELANDGLLIAYDPPAEVLAAIPQQLNGMEIYDPAHRWFGAALSGFGIITNERVRAAVGLPEVHSWVDLADPRLTGWISACDPRFSGSALTIYEIILQSCGWEKGWRILTEMSGNVRSFLASSASSAVEVGTGDAAYGVAIDSYGEAQAAYYGAENVTFHLPEGQTMIDPDSIAILKNPPHLEMARHFLEFVLSREGQLLWMRSRGAPGGATRHIINRMSIRPALYDELVGKSPIVTNPFQLRYPFVYSNQLGSRRRSILSVLIATWLIDTHDMLVPAWKALNSPAAQRLPQSTRNALIEQLTAPPCPEDELLRLAAVNWKDSVQRTAITTQWQSAALDRYKNMLALIKVNEPRFDSP